MPSSGAVRAVDDLPPEKDPPVTNKLVVPPFRKRGSIHSIRRDAHTVITIIGVQKATFLRRMF